MPVALSLTISLTSALFCFAICIGAGIRATSGEREALFPYLVCCLITALCASANFAVVLRRFL